MPLPPPFYICSLYSLLLTARTYANQPLSIRDFIKNAHFLVLIIQRAIWCRFYTLISVAQKCQLFRSNEKE